MSERDMCVGTSFLGRKLLIRKHVAAPSVFSMCSQNTSPDR